MVGREDVWGRLTMEEDSVLGRFEQGIDEEELLEKTSCAEDTKDEEDKFVPVEDALLGLSYFA